MSKLASCKMNLFNRGPDIFPLCNRFDNDDETCLKGKHGMTFVAIPPTIIDLDNICEQSEADTNNNSAVTSVGNV